jgi:hypothetical protein
MSKIKISLIDHSDVGMPQPGEQFIFADGSNLGHLSTKDAQGNITDLTEKGGGSDLRDDELVNGGSNTGLKIFECKVTLTAEDLFEMNWLSGKNPDGGIKVLDAPGTGKSNLLLLGASASWKPEGGAAIIAEPYAEYRSLDIYYKTPGYNGEWSTETAMSIPLLREPFSTWTGKSRNETRAQWQAGKVFDTERYLLYNQREPLNIDRETENQVWQPVSQVGENGISSYSSENSELWMSINGALKSGAVGIEEASKGKIMVCFYYGILDLKTAAPTKATQRQLPALNNPDQIFLNRSIGGGMNMGIDFADIDWMKPAMHEFNNELGRRANPPVGDYQMTWRAERDAYFRSQNEWQLALHRRINGERIPEAPEQITDLIEVTAQPLPQFFERGMFRHETYMGPDSTKWGWSYSIAEYSTPLWKNENANVATADWIYEPSIQGVLHQRREAIEIGQAVTWLENVGKVTSIDITSPGTGYLVGQRVWINPADGSGNTNSSTWNWNDLMEDPMKVGNGCYAEVTAIGSNGEILQIEIFENKNIGNEKTGWYGGYLYDSNATASAGSGLPTDPELRQEVEDLLNQIASTKLNIESTLDQIKNNQEQIEFNESEVVFYQAQLSSLTKQLAEAEAADPQDPALIDDLTSQINDVQATIKKLETKISDLEQTGLTLTKQLADFQNELDNSLTQINTILNEEGATAEFNVNVEFSPGCWVPDQNNMQLLEIIGYPGQYPSSANSSVYNTGGAPGRTSLYQIDETRRNRRDAGLKALNEVCLASTPWIWAVYYLPEFQIKKYKL